MRDRVNHDNAGLLRLGLLYVFSCAAYIALGRGIHVPVIAPDEFTYGELARSIADGHGLCTYE